MHSTNMPVEISRRGAMKNSVSLSLKDNFNGKEKKRIIHSLEKNGYNISATARELNIPRTTFHAQIRKYKISV